MDYNNYQPQYQQPQYEQPQYQQPMYQQPIYQQPTQPDILPPDIQQMVDSVFGKALASTIMSEIPVASIIAFFFGNNAFKTTNEIVEICVARGIRVPGKLKAARILSRIGKFAGLGFSIFWGCYFGFILAYVLFFIVLVSGI